MLPSQEESLRVKKRVPPNTTEEDRWNEMYMVLFPDADIKALPSPCKSKPHLPLFMKRLKLYLPFGVVANFWSSW